MVAVQDALGEFYAREHLPDGGTDGSYFDWARAFGMPFPIPNTRVRLAILPYHDLHHLVAGYATDEAGEGEISGWTLGTGGGPLFGEMYDLGAFLLGLVRFPRRSVAAFYRGRQCRNLYRKPAEECMAQSVETLRAWCGADAPLGPVTGMDRIALARTVLSGLVVWATPVAPVVMFGLVAVDLATAPPKAAAA
ncbi:MAG: hypothetical protein R3F61_06640 [Myxococcota bacterium]